MREGEADIRPESGLPASLVFGRACRVKNRVKHRVDRFALSFRYAGGGRHKRRRPARRYGTAEKVRQEVAKPEPGAERSNVNRHARGIKTVKYELSGSPFFA